MADPADLAAWVRQCVPSAVGSAVPSADAARVGEARRLREAVHQLVQAARGPGGAGACGREALECVNRAAARPVPTPSLDPSGGIRWRADDPVDAALSLVARDALDLATSASATRVRQCAGPLCGALFLDGSRPGTRRWCAMGVCGNAAKKQALRTRSAR
ncbi:CGNR zinc finger domain-containing protein [Peterkaempfera bronchialis]|uniref:CGNR zinc finger domain-containing protein n=1 Tax=Peterkaempfera bronchialis TaxID=2126346 RepID=UPI001E4D4C34|nr:ABATE domain-containing protein [Peterkaempfera bronchialis]